MASKTKCDDHPGGSPATRDTMIAVLIIYFVIHHELTAEKAADELSGLNSEDLIDLFSEYKQARNRALIGALRGDGRMSVGRRQADRLGKDVLERDARRALHEMSPSERDGRYINWLKDRRRQRRVAHVIAWYRRQNRWTKKNAHDYVARMSESEVQQSYDSIINSEKRRSLSQYLRAFDKAGRAWIKNLSDQAVTDILATFDSADQDHHFGPDWIVDRGQVLDGQRQRVLDDFEAMASQNAAKLKRPGYKKHGAQVVMIFHETANENPADPEKVLFDRVAAETGKNPEDAAEFTRDVLWMTFNTFLKP